MPGCWPKPYRSVARFTAQQCDCLHTLSTAERLESELGPEQPMFAEGCQRDWDALPRPDPPLTVGLDGGYVHSSQQRSRRDGWFEVIAGKSTPTEGSAKCFGFVQTYDTKPKRRLFEVLRSQGMAMNQQVTFFTDGGDDVRELPLHLNPPSEQYLDWSHVAMRITVMSQLAKGLRSRDNPTVAKTVLEDFERLKWFLWHGNVYRALETIDGLEFDLDLEGTGPEQRKLLKAIVEFGGYIRANGAWIPNYGERHRNGETISSAFVESAVNQIVSKRMVKKQQMRWAPKSAHLLLQVRTRVLNSDLGPCVQAVVPSVRHTSRVNIGTTGVGRLTSAYSAHSPGAAIERSVIHRNPHVLVRVCLRHLPVWYWVTLYPVPVGTAAN